MKKVSTAVVALALGASEVSIREMCDGAKEIDFAEILKLINSKISLTVATRLWRSK